METNRVREEGEETERKKCSYGDRKKNNKEEIRKRRKGSDVNKGYRDAICQ